MKVQIRDIEKTTGLFKKVVHKGVALNVTLTADELRLIEQYDLKSVRMPSLATTVEARNFARQYPDIAKGGVGAAALVANNGTDQELWFANRAECEVFKEQIKDDLTNLKNAIAHVSKSKSDEQFEL